MTWQEAAACATEPRDIFFPVGTGDQTHAARKICQRCPVIGECLEEALRLRDTFGFRGGMAGEARRRLIYERRRAARGEAVV